MTEFSDFGAKESQGYAHIFDADGAPIADLVSMALVPIQSSPPPPVDRVRVETKSGRSFDRGDRR